MHAPKIAIVVPSYNQGVYLEATLHSIIDQNYPNAEIIVIDGGSTDNSVDIIRRYDKHLAFWVSEPDGGQTKGLIKGFQRATGDIQCWLNSDDLHELNTLSEVAEYFSRHPNIDAVYGDAVWIDANDRPLRIQREIPLTGLSGCTPTTIYHVCRCSGERLSMTVLVVSMIVLISRWMQIFGCDLLT